MNESPVIGITVSIDHGKIIRKNHDYLYVKKAYSEAVKKAGGQPILISPDLTAEVAAEICDAIIISGGDDIPPSLYGEPVESEINQESAERIHWERRVLDLFVQSEGPLLGVCYGMQLINVHFGGSLYQDIHTGFENALDHGGLGKATSHRVTIADDSWLFPLFGSQATVCSTHHQAIKKLAPRFRTAAVSEDGIIEAIECGNTWAIEWHPEADATGDLIYRLLVERAKQRNSARRTTLKQS
ncbi:MAG TPA: gamma-glutamyl-gamma-aminobutyrate hydrolase family protein [Blastocatellia bacterium]|nr:gamma-glutamyl-gamma-aminobutyrate hydrolase family protein [Blastocatellia bacterium]